MNMRLRFFSFCLVFVSLFGLFSGSLTAHASNIDIVPVDKITLEPIESDSTVSTMNFDEDDIINGNVNVTLDRQINNNGWLNVVTTTTDYKKSYDHNMKYLEDYISVRTRLIIEDNESKKLFEKDDTINLSVSGIVDYFELNGKSYKHNTKFTDLEIRLTTYDGSFKYIEPTYKVVNHGDTYSIEFEEMTIPEDTYKFEIYTYSTIGNYGMHQYYGQDVAVKKWDGFFGFKFNMSYTDTTKGLLGSIIEWLTNIRDNIVGLPSKIASSIKGFFDGVVNAVVNLGDKLLDGIKSLFIPTTEDLQAEKIKWDELLEDRFGALYEVVALIDEYANTFSENNQESIVFPTVEIPLGNTNFSFGGWNVDVTPNGFDTLINALKLIISISATILFINGLRNKFERLISQ